MTTEMSANHEAEVLTRTKVIPSWQVRCPMCGDVGLPQDYEADAEAIRDRHHEVNGFERRGTTA